MILAEQTITGSNKYTKSDKTNKWARKNKNKFVFISSIVIYGQNF